MDRKLHRELDEREQLLQPLFPHASYSSTVDAGDEELGQNRSRPVSEVTVYRHKPHKLLFGPFVMAACIGAFVYTIYLNGWEFEDWTVNPTIGPSRDVLVKAGAKDVAKIRRGEWWRWLTPMFLHGGLIHLFCNMTSLLRLGFPMEQTFGAVRVALVYLLSGVFATITSAAFLPILISVGASGALFGLLGAVWADLIVNMSLLDVKCLAFVTVLNLALGLLPFLDNFAHVGGFLCGFLCGLVLLHEERRPVVKKRRGHRCCKGYQRLLQGVAFLALLVAFPAGFYAVYQGIDPNGWCDWCAYVSCLPIPGLWSCNTDFACSGVSYTNGSVLVFCPNGEEVWTEAGEFPYSLCREVCI